MIEPLVSIIMPAYNAALYIAESIESVLAQTYSNWELIIINDGSTDDTANVADLYAQRDIRIKLINQSNQKSSAARNAGLTVAGGEWIAFLDADDLWVPEKLTKQLACVKTYPDVGLVYTDGYVFNDYNTANNQPYGTITGRYSGAEMYRWEYKGNYIAMLSVLVRKTVLDAVGPQDKALAICQDWDLWVRVAAMGTVFYGLPDRLFYYRRHNTNISSNMDLINFEKACLFVKNFNKELLTQADIIALKSFLRIAISELVRKGKITDALNLNARLTGIFNQSVTNLNSRFIASLNNSAYWLVRLLFKADSLFSKNL